MKVDFYHYNFHETINWENIYKALVKLGVDAQFIVEPPDTNTSRTLSWDGYKRITSYMRLCNYPYLPRPRYEDADAAITTQEKKWLQHYKGLKINSLYGSTLTKDAAGYRQAKLTGFDGILAHGWYSKHRIITNGIPAEKVAIMGFPKYVDYFRGNVERREWQKIFNLNPAKKTVVYIPSWHKNSSIDIFLDAIGGLSEEFNILIKPHHNNIEIEQDRILKMQHLKNVFVQDAPCSSVPFYVVGDIVIADTRSGAFPEGVLTNSRLIGLHVRDNTQADLVEPVVYQLAPVCEIPGQLLKAINEFANSETDKYQHVKEFIKPYLFTDFQGNDDLEAAKAIIEFIEQNTRTVVGINAITATEHSAGTVTKKPVAKPGDKQLFREGFQYLRQGNAQRAAESFDKVAKNCATLPNLHLALATARFQLGDLYLARKACQAELMIQPGHDGAKRLLEQINQTIREYELFRKKDAGKAHIVFIHRNNPEYLKYSLAQAKTSNPTATIHLIGDQSNNTYDFVDHHSIEKYCRDTLEFRRCYKHLSTNRIELERFCFERWFILNEFVTANNIEKCLYVDSDVMIYCDVSHEFERLKEWDFTLGQTVPGHLAMCPSPIYWNNLEALNAFCKFTMDIYTGKDIDNYDKALNLYNNWRARGLPGGVSDMFLFSLFQQSCNFRILDIGIVIDGSTYDLNINIPQIGQFEYQMLDGIKMIDWIGRYPYGTDTKSGRKIRFNVLHCQGSAKKYMKRLYRGGCIDELSEAERKAAKSIANDTIPVKAEFKQSELDNIIPPEIKNDEFYFLIRKLAQQENIKTILEIGSSSGTGSTEAFVKGLHKNPNKPTLFCMELSKPRFTELQTRYAADSNVKCYNISSVSLDKFPTEQEVSSFYSNIKTTLNNYPIERVLGWLRQDIEYMKNSGHCENGIQIIKGENNIKNFDMVLIDGSAFTGTAELDEVYGARFILLDDINSFKNYQNYKRLITEPDYSLVTENWQLRNGYAVFKKLTTSPDSYTSIKSAVESVEGLLCPGQEEFLFNKVKSLPEDAVIVEIGSGKGRSTVAMGYACMGTNRKIYCIDTWQGHNFDSSERGFFDTWQKNIQKNGLDRYVTSLRGYSHEILARWDELTRGKKIDFAFIDGSHEYQDVLKDFEMCYSLLKESGWIALHDIVKTWPGPERLWNERAKFVLTNHEYCSSIACGQKNSGLSNDGTMEHIGELGNITSPIVKNAKSHEQLSKRLRLLLVYSLHPVTPRITLPEWIKEALRKHYASDVEVFACGPENEINIPDSPDFYNRVAGVVKDLDIDAIWDIEGGAATKDFMFKRYPRKISIPKLWWAIDTHQYLPLMVEKAKFFDIVFSAQKNAVPSLGPGALWLPAGASIHEVDYQLKRTIDVGFIGHISPKVHQRRKKIIERLQKEIDGFRCFKGVFLREKAELASQMKIMVNISLKNDINFRVFETLACGAMLITDKIYNNGFDELFEDGKHLVTFETEEELIDKINYYLKHESQREHIAKAGQQRVLQQFTHRELLKKPLNIIAKLVEQHRQKTQQTVLVSIGKAARCWCKGQLKESVHPLYGQCQFCGTLVLAKQLTKDQLKEFYTFDKYWHNHVVKVSGHPPIEQRATNDFKDRIPVWHKLLRKYKPEIENLLEIGCAHGGFLHYCREHGVKNIVGIEPDEQTCEFARRHFNLPYVISGLFPDVSLPLKKFDVVAGFDVIEHFLDPVKAMQKVANLLKEDGIYIFQIPCYRGEGRQWQQFRPDEHIFLYNSHSIQRLFARAGLEITEILPGYFRDDIFVIGRKKSVRNLLFVRPDSIGDNVLAASMLPHIRENYKDAKITVVCQEHIAELYETCPYTDDIIVFNRKRALEDGQYRQEIINRLRALKPDLSLNSVFSREPLTDVLAIECGARQRVALEGDLSNISDEVRQKHNQFYSKLLPSEGKYKPEMERHRDFLRGLCIDVPSPKPIVWIASEDEKFADSFFQEHNLNPDKTIALFAGAQYEMRLYEKYGKSLSEFCKENQFNVIALGSKCEHGINQRNLDEIGVKTVNLSGKTTIRQSAAILKHCGLAVGAETGLAHISCAVKTPNVILLGGGHFGRFMPYSPLTSIVCLPLQCYGCNWRCRYKRIHCIEDIKPEVITEALCRTLDGPAEKPRVFIQSDSLWQPQPQQPRWMPFENYISSDDIELIQVGRTSPAIQQISQKTDTAKLHDSKYLVTAIVSTYNSEDFLRGCLEDLENQTIADRLEITVVNSGSQQNEESIVREFQQKYDNIVYIKTDHREGVYAAWNRAVKAAKGAFLTNANTDDRHREDALEIMAETLLANPDIALVYGDQICTDTPNGTFANHHAIEMARRAEYSHKRLLFGCCVGSQPMWRKSLHTESGYFDDTLTCAGDWDFWLRVSISSRYKFKHIPEFLGLYYYNENGIEHGRKIHSLYERYIVGKRYGNPYISVIPLYTSKDNPLVSVIMPAYNAAKHIAEAVESVLIQNYRNFELIIVDDGSTDDTKDIVASFKDDKIKYLYKDNCGPSSARNLGISKAKGQYIMPLDADDMMAPNFIAKHLAEFEKHPDIDLVYCDVLLIGENGNPIRIMNKPEYKDRRYLIRDLLRAGHPVVPFRLGIRRSVFDRIGFYDENLLIGEDYDMMRRFVKAGLKAHHLSETLHLRRMHADSLSRNLSGRNAKYLFEILNRFIDTFTYDELFPDIRWECIPPEKRYLYAKCLAAVTYVAIGQEHVRLNALPIYAKVASRQACLKLRDSLKIDPGNQLARQLLQKLELGEQAYDKKTQQIVC